MMYLAGLHVRKCAVNRVLEAGAQAHVELAAGQVVGDGVLGVVDVGDPVVAAHVGDVHQVEAVQTEPDFLEVAEQTAGGAVVLADELVTQAHIHTLVGGLAHVGVGTRQVGRRGGQTVADDAFEAELQARDAGEVVGEEQGNAVALVGGAGHLDAVQVLLRLHQRETEPGVGALDELSEQFHVNAGDIALGGVDAAIDELEVKKFEKKTKGTMHVSNIEYFSTWTEGKDYKLQLRAEAIGAVDGLNGTYRLVIPWRFIEGIEIGDDIPVYYTVCSTEYGKFIADVELAYE